MRPKKIIALNKISRHYLLWSITENKNNNLAQELKECLPKSDMGSYEKCNELLKQITDYNSCVEAGFSIRKSNPPHQTAELLWKMKKIIKKYACLGSSSKTSMS